MSGNLNLDLLIPEKFQKENFPVLPVLLEELDELVYGWVQEIQGLADLINPETVSNDYMQYLAGLLGAVLSPQDTATEAQRRSELRQVVDWIKMKGTYASVQVIENMLNTNFEFKEMYTNNYVDFVLTDWFVALNPGDNPPGLDGSYYNSPHFGYMIKLNVKHAASGIWTNDYLYIPDWFLDIDKYVERTRPIHTVPHYYVLLEPVTNDDGAVMTMEGDIHTQCKGLWPQTKLYFDDSNQFDDSENWDVHDDSFYESITKWIIGTGSKGASPDDGGWTDLETPVSNGTIDIRSIGKDKVVWEFIIPKQNQLGISELGLYSEGPDTIRVASLFPDVNLAGNVDVRVTVTVNRVF
jgi:hypothetical protein